MCRPLFNPCIVSPVPHSPITRGSAGRLGNFQPTLCYYWSYVCVYVCMHSKLTTDHTFSDSRRKNWRRENKCERERESERGKFFFFFLRDFFFSGWHGSFFYPIAKNFSTFRFLKIHFLHRRINIFFGFLEWAKTPKAKMQFVTFPRNEKGINLRGFDSWLFHFWKGVFTTLSNMMSNPNRNEILIL